MPHSPELIASILGQVQQTYPAEYRFEIERPLFLKDRRMQPDIQVFDPAGELRCVVEIGYTRPEKLKSYRQLGIPDVRWYSKAGELIDDYFEVEHRVEIVERRFEYSGAPWVPLYFSSEDRPVACGRSLEAAYRVVDFPSFQAIRYANQIANEHDSIDVKIRDFFPRGLPKRRSLPDDYPLLMGVMELIFETPYFTCCEGAFYSNGAAIFAVAHCDLCGDLSIRYASVDWDQLLINPGHSRHQYDALVSFENFIKAAERRAAGSPDVAEPIPFTEIVRHIAERWEVRLDLEHLEPAQWLA